MEIRRIQSGLLFFLDLAGLLLFYNLAHKFRLDEWISPTSSHLWILIITALITLYIMDVYRISSSYTLERLPLDSFAAAIIVAFASVVVTYLVGVGKFAPVFGRGVLPVAMALFALWAPFWRWVFVRWHSDTGRVVNWLTVCSESSFEVFQQDNAKRDSDIGFTRINAESASREIHEKLKQSPRDSGVIIENFERLGKDMASLLKDLEARNVPVLSITEFYERFWLKLPILNLEGDWLIRSRGFDLLHDQVGIRLKRVADLTLGIAALSLFLPVMLVIATLIRLDSPGKVLYSQRRVGLKNQVFTLYKFRSMVEDAEKVGAQWATVEDPRITRLGKILRASRLDELPQLWNLIIGNMSLIGPRPERPEFVEQLEEAIPFYGIRHQVTPGVTGWAQVMFPYGSSVEDARKKLEFDLYYIKNHSIKLDLAIILKTFGVVISGGGR